jgi:hypothetical protein
MTSSIEAPRPVWGLVGVIAGLIAVALVTLSLSSIFAEPQPSMASQIGEMAAEIRKAAMRSMMGDAQPVPDTPAMTVAVIITLAIPVLAGGAALCGAIGLFRREPRSLPLLALGFGSGAFVMQYLFWMALFIGGVVLMVAIVNNLDSILDF